MTNRFAALTKEQFMEGLLPDHTLAFSDIPTGLLDEDVIIKWAAGSVTERYAQIPQPWLTGRVLLYAACEGVQVLNHIKSDQVANYLWLVIACVNNDYTALADVDPLYQNDKFIDSIFMWITVSKQILLLREIEWVGEKASKELIIKYCLKDINFLLNLSPKLFPKNADEYFNLEGDLNTIRERGRLDLIASKIFRGAWPDSENLFLRFPKPESLLDAVGRVESAPPGQYIETLYMSYVMTYPIEQVVPAMKGNRLKSLLLEMYSSEALIPFSKTDVNLRGVMLEGVLGL